MEYYYPIDNKYILWKDIQVEPFNPTIILHRYWICPLKYEQ